MTYETRPLRDNDSDSGTRQLDGLPLVSVFTATHDIEQEIDTAVRSLLRQTYPRWEWVVVDDSSRPETFDHLMRLADAPAADGRIRLVRQYPLPHSVGASKAAAAGLCRGEFIVELDHDDELMPNALELVAATFGAHPDVDFVYSDWIDWIDNPDGEAGPGRFPAGWGFGYGGYASEMVGGRRVPVTLSPPITWETIRHIVARPNHLRAWRTVFYRRIGGHDPRLPVADDYELMVRTFLNGLMAHIPRPLYVQHHSPAGTNTSRHRNAEIQQRVEQIAAEQQASIDRRCLSLGMLPRTTSP
ncbi:MAG: glycosyltransferase [Thermomicrobiales bacterium]